MSDVNNKESNYGFIQTHGGKAPFPGGEWGESSEFHHENDESLTEENRANFADTLLSSDEKLYEEIYAALTASPDVEAGDYTLEVRAGDVTISGTVQAKATREAAMNVVQGVSGVHSIRNEIKLGGNL